MSLFEPSPARRGEQGPTPALGPSGLGARFTDHHVPSLDDLMMGKAHLESNTAYVHSWGVGRHVDGSQIFDHWRDPFGNEVEHWTDGDQVNDDYPRLAVRPGCPSGVRR